VSQSYPLCWFSCFALHLPYDPTSPSLSLPDTPPTWIYTLSLHDALPIWVVRTVGTPPPLCGFRAVTGPRPNAGSASGSLASSLRSKSTRLNSSHRTISYAVFCLKKKKQYNKEVKNNKVLTH